MIFTNYFLIATTHFLVSFSDIINHPTKMSNVQRDSEGNETYNRVAEERGFPDNFLKETNSLTQRYLWFGSFGC